jgi:hypothetical protein
VQIGLLWGLVVTSHLGQCSFDHEISCALGAKSVTRPRSGAVRNLGCSTSTECMRMRERIFPWEKGLEEDPKNEIR